MNHTLMTLGTAAVLLLTFSLAMCWALGLWGDNLIDKDDDNGQD